MKVSPGSIVASNRIATYLSTRLEAPLIDRKAALTGEAYERIFLVNGPGLYCDYLPEMEQLCSNAHELVWIGNDYAIRPPGFVKRHPNVVHFSAYENILKAPRHHLVNWNQLTYEPLPRILTPRFEGLCYYGAFRKDREKYFDRYFAADRGYDLFLSSSVAGLTKFRKYAPFHKWDGADLISRLRHYQAALYIEDRRSHRVYCSPANRFYEAVSARVPILFDARCWTTFDRAGIDVSPWLVDGPADVAQALGRIRDWREEQGAALWSVDYRNRLDAEAGEALASLD